MQKVREHSGLFLIKKWKNAQILLVVFRKRDVTAIYNKVYINWGEIGAAFSYVWKNGLFTLLLFYCLLRFQNGRPSTRAKKPTKNKEKCYTDLLLLR